MELPLIKPAALEKKVPELFERLLGRPYPFLFDSSLLVKGLGRYAIMSSDPFLVMRSRGTRIRLEWGERTETITGHPLDVLKELLGRYRLAPAACPLPFAGGAAGYFSYDLGRMLERLPSWAEDDLHTPDLCLGFYDRAVVVDAVDGSVRLVSTGFPETEAGAARRRASERLEELQALLVENRGRETVPAGGITVRSHALSSHFDRESYCRAVQRVREYIAAGDIFQVNLSQRFSLPRIVEPWLLYRRLREISPAPMAAFLDCGDIQVVSSSMERFLQVTGGRAETRPIKGTRPRGRDAREDARLRDELWHSEKDRAELVMIVDMERNDLGRVCRTGSVHVPELYRLEEYATVFHLVATVTGELPAEKDAVDLLRAAFPGGSISGAPKIRAMEIIEELEPVRRGIYTGSIGYIGFDGNADLNIVIRTLIFKNGQIHFQVGGGITIDSDPYREYLETLDKARAMIKALGLAERGEISCTARFV
ncbi:aminodeoxychorismate synthase component I [Desulfotomaculum copahuensis]|uniref:aminodeoxychorismate synthase n=1 Tax=Desulfotomaculum copahuensis TaxID=1838280 RepID=A0A1B7LDV6_9FIRM|nr:aminodeoxychorismate synthase component I [Desulfotomaculum copahuensis]OAT81291.1 aminodeoxychorismate synthase, component I [Desulfotomaculum copahuensis]